MSKNKGKKEKFNEDKKVFMLMEKLRELKSKYNTAIKENNKIRREFKAAQSVQGSKTTRKICIKPESGKETEAVVFMIASDWHTEEEVRRSTVLGKNVYNLDIAKQRSDFFWDKSARLIKKESKDVIIKKVVIGLLGDFITGRLHEPNLEVCSLRPVEAIIYVQELIESGLIHMLNNTKKDLKFVVVCKAGNHSRITKKVHHANEMGNALEYSMYYNLKKRFKNEDRIEFVIDDSYLTYINCFGLRIRFHHGHAIRYYGGVGGITIPMNKANAQWDVDTPADISVCGHLHQYVSMRRWLANGSLIGYSPYAMANKFEFEPPSQAFFLVDNKRGKTISMPIYFVK